MNAWHTLVFGVALAIAGDVPWISHLYPAAQYSPPPSSLPAPQSTAPATPAQQPSAPASQPPSQTNHSRKPLTPESELLLVRSVDGEFAKAVQAIPSKKKGFVVHVGKPVPQQDLSDALRLWGTAAYAGDTVQITGLEFRSHEVLVQINGGGKKHFNWRQHLQVGMGNVGSPPPPEPTSDKPLGGVLVLDYGRPVPDMSGEDLKQDLGVFLDFSKQHSAAVNWVESLPPKYQAAIRDHKAVVGMDQEMVIASMGRPDKKVRERDANGAETEDWIYGLPPAKTTFVTFAGDNVVRVKEYD